MLFRYLTIGILTLFLSGHSYGQQGDTRYTVMNIHALKHYPFQPQDDALGIIQRVIDNKTTNNFTQTDSICYNYYKKTSVDIVSNKYALEDQLSAWRQNNDFMYKQLVKPFEHWLRYAKKVEANPDNLALTTLLFEDSKTQFSDNKNKRNGSLVHASRKSGLYEVVGQQNIAYFLEEIFGNIDLYQEDSDLMLFSFKNPLEKKSPEIYQYRILGEKFIDKTKCYEIAFFSENFKVNTFAGYLYITTDGKFALKQALFTLNNPDKMNFLNNILVRHTYAASDSLWVPVKKENTVILGNDVRGRLLVERTSVYSNFRAPEHSEKLIWKNLQEKNADSRSEADWDSMRPIPLESSETQIDELVKVAAETPKFRTIQRLIPILLNDHFAPGSGKFEFGPLSQTISFNDMEGLRLKVQGNSTIKLSNQLLAGAYLAYGTGDNVFKYRGDLIYSFFPKEQYIWEYPKRLLSFSYVNDLNIPGQDLLTTKRDNFMYSFSHASTNNMSLQRIGLLTYESENSQHFSYEIGGKYTYDQPKGVVKYAQITNSDTAVIDHIITSEVRLSLRFAPKEKFIQNRDKRIYIERGKIEFNLNHRSGIRGLLGSAYSYQITDFSTFKKFTFNNNIGTAETRLSGGYVWGRVPFPLLFIPNGNQSYIFQSEGFNCMNFYEFTTDRYLSGNVNFMFNWTPIKLFSSKDKTKFSLGTRAFYGPLSDKNNPELHPELFVFNQGVKPLGETPYIEANIGLANLFKVLRIEYTRRLTYLGDEAGGHKIPVSALLFSGSFSF